MVNIVLPDNVQRSLAFYLAMEEFVARNFEGETFFVWQSGPTVIYGRNQVLENEVNLEYCKAHGVEIVHRKSGGGCVYSDLGNIMISYVSNHGEASEVFERYLLQMTDLLSGLGVQAERSGRNDILVNGKKVSGNAFRQLPSKSIVHGTLLCSTDFKALEQALLPPVEKLQRHGVESVRQRVGNLQDTLAIDIETLKQKIVGHFCDSKIVLTPENIAEITELQKSYPVLSNN
jgi:lipoyltransferase/lipoate-protein ligase